MAGAGPRASRRDCGTRGRRWAPCGSVRYCHWDLQSNAVSRDCRRACGARGRRWAPRSLQWQAQYPEPPEGTAARVVAAGPPAVLCVTAIVICKAMDVTGCEWHCNGCGTRSHHSLTHSITDSGSLRSVQRLQKGLRRSVERLQKGLRRAWSPLGPPLSPQYPEPPEGAAARAVAAGPPAVLCVTAIVIWKAMVVTGQGCAHTVSVHYCHCDFHSVGSRRFGIAL